MAMLQYSQFKSFKCALYSHCFHLMVELNACISTCRSGFICRFSHHKKYSRYNYIGKVVAIGLYLRKGSSFANFTDMKLMHTIVTF